MFKKYNIITDINDNKYQVLSQGGILI